MLELGWAQGATIILLETAGLRHRCAPAIEGCLSVAVMTDNLGGVDTPQKIGQVLFTADVVILKGRRIGIPDRRGLADRQPGGRRAV